MSWLVRQLGAVRRLLHFYGRLTNYSMRPGAAGTVRVVYVSPLKALNNDIRRNLLKAFTGTVRLLLAARHADAQDSGDDTQW